MLRLAEEPRVLATGDLGSTHPTRLQQFLAAHRYGTVQACDELEGVRREDLILPPNRLGSGRELVSSEAASEAIHFCLLKDEKGDFGGGR
jgi:hypothetical protein